MTHTRRIYNREPLLGGPGLKGIARSTKQWKIGTPITVYGMFLGYQWYAYHPYKQLCMGRCPVCRRGAKKVSDAAKTLRKRNAMLDIRYAIENCEVL